jgi:hypothetical protein
MGNVRDGSIALKATVGDVYKTTMYGSAEIVAVAGTKNLTIKFLNTGNEQVVQFDGLVTGLVRDTKEMERKMAEEVARSELFQLRKEEIKREEAERQKRLLEARKQAQERREREQAALVAKEQEQAAREALMASWLEEVLTVTEVDTNLSKPCKTRVDEDIKKDGKWVLRYSDPVHGFIQTRLGGLHNNMTQRGRLGGACQEYNKTYSGVTVHPDFKDAQKFCNWATAQRGWGLGYQLEKDLLVPGNREYGPDVCCFLPHKINIAIIQPKTGTKSWLRRDRHGNVYLALQIDQKPLVLRGFSTENEVHLTYKNLRERYVKRLAEQFKSTIDPRAYDALMAWELRIPEVNFNPEI